MKKKDMYKGHAKHVTWLGKFVIAFEHSVKGEIQTKSDFIKMYPQTHEIFELQIKSKVHNAKIKKIDTILENGKVSLVYNGNKCLILELCRHLRNSICHANLKVEDNKLHILDFYQRKYSSKGYLSVNTGISFVKTFVSEYESKFKD